MCGISAILAKTSNIYDILIEMLKELENRGYDSCGIATMYNDILTISKHSVGEEKSPMSELEKDIKFHNANAHIGMGHTRWATHGKKTVNNAHPLVDNLGNICIVHNGIIDNYVEIKNFLKDNGVHFNSETDTEVIVNYIAFQYKTTKNMLEAITDTLANLKGSYALCIFSTYEPDKLYCVRNECPLLIASNDNCVVVCSEEHAIGNVSGEYILLENFDIAQIFLDNGNLKINVHNNYLATKKCVSSGIELPNKYDNWTEKEIEDQIEVTKNIVERIKSNGTIEIEELNSRDKMLENIENIILLGCGSSYYACMFGGYFLREHSGANTVTIYDPVEFNEQCLPKRGKTLIILVSQSGETKDLINSFKCLRTDNVVTMGVLNVKHSQIDRLANCSVYTRAGREIGVASTKSFFAQCLTLVLLSLWLCKNKSNKELALIDELVKMPQKVKNVIEMTKMQCKNFAELLSTFSSTFVLGRGCGEAIAKEGCLKMKEIGYIHAEGYNSSALKHGPYALLAENVPVILLIFNDKHYERNFGIKNEVMSRTSNIYTISDIEDFSNIKIGEEINSDLNVLLSVIPLQYIAYFLSIKKNRNPDRPLNLAKVVTVE